MHNQAPSRQPCHYFPVNSLPIRAMRGMSQAELAAKAGVSAPAIAGFETGKRDIRASTIVKLCDALGVKVTYSVGNTDITGP